MVGAHRDGWGPGAADNVSGTVSVLEAARAVMEEVKAGRRPQRTIVFATWDAEEWGLVGSTEYVEDDSLRLSRHAVAYLNQDVAASGPSFGGGGSPSLRATLRDVARVVPDPSGGGSVYAEWRKRRASRRMRSRAWAIPVAARTSPASTTTSASRSPSGASAAPAACTTRSTTPSTWMRRFGDGTFRYHAAAAMVNAAMLLRLANADVLPYDYVEYARTMRGYLPALDRTMAARRLAGASSAPLAAAIDRMERAAQAFTTARDAALASATPAARTLVATNEALKQVERALTRPEGLRTRPWFRNLIYAADEDNGYANMVFPSVSEAVRDADAARTTAEVADLASRFDAATRALETATRAVQGAR